MDPVTTGALIQTGGQLAGGVISKVSGKKAAKKAYKRQKEFAKNAIQWKVKDAKAAGLHPLYAMGGGGANYQPSFIAGQDPMGSAASGAAETIGAAYTQSQAPPPGTPSGVMGQAQLRAVNASAQRDEAAAIRDLSAAKRMEGQVNASQDSAVFSGSGSGTVESGTVPPHRVTPLAPDVRSRAAPGGPRQAGKNPLWQRYQYGPRKSDWLDIPFSDEGPFEEMGPGKIAAIFYRMMQNKAKSAGLPGRRKRSAGSSRRARRARRY